MRHNRLIDIISIPMNLVSFIVFSWIGSVALSCIFKTIWIWSEVETELNSINKDRLMRKRLERSLLFARPSEKLHIECKNMSAKENEREKEAAWKQYWMKMYQSCRLTAINNQESRHKHVCNSNTFLFLYVYQSINECVCIWRSVCLCAHNSTTCLLKS